MNDGVMAPEERAVASMASLDTGCAVRAVRVTTLRVDTVTNFDLYMPNLTGQGLVLYRKRSLAFTDDVRHRLEENNVKELFITLGDVAEYRRYMEKNLGAVLSDPEINAEEKTTILYDSAQELMQEVLSAPRSGEVVPRSMEFIRHASRFVLTEDAAFKNLLRMMSFDYYTYTHSVNVFVFGLVLLQRLGYDKKLSEEFSLGLLLHDIGKSEIDHSIVTRQGPLSPQEWEIMRKHPLHGYELLSGRKGITALSLDVVRHHHEKMNGSGYPDRLPGPSISAFARTAAIVDIFDALTTNRPYKAAIGSFPALKFMQEQMADELDEQIFRIFVEMMGSSV